MVRRVPHFLQTRQGDDFRGIFRGNVATKIDCGINIQQETLFFMAQHEDFKTSDSYSEYRDSSETPNEHSDYF